MTIYLKQSTASQEVPLGYFVDSTDGNTEETALTIANTDIKLWKAGSTTLANKNSGGATHISNGVYYAVLDATDTNTLGSLVIYVHVSGALTVKLECVVLAANVYDSLIGGGDILDVSVTQWTGTNVAAPDIAGYPKATLKTGTGAGELDVTSGVVKANLAQILGTALTETAGQLAAGFRQFFNIASPTSTMNTITLVSTVTTLTNAPSDSSGVTTLLSRLSATRAGYLDNLSAGAVASASKLLKYFQLALRKDAAIATDNATELSELNANGGSGAGAYVSTTDSQEALRDRGDAAWITGTAPLDAAGTRSALGLASANLDTQLTAIDDYLDTEIAAIKAKTDLIPASPAATGDIPSASTIADSVWNRLTSAITTASSIGKLLVDNINATISSRATQTSLDTLDDYVDTEVAAIKAKTDLIPASPAATGDIPSAATIADAVWDEAISGHSTTGSTGKALQDAGAAGTPPSAADIADAVWDEAISGHTASGSTGEALGAAGGAGDPWITTLPGAYSAGQAGYILGTNLNATVGSRATQTSVDTVDDFLDTEIAAIKAKTDNLPAAPAATGDIPSASTIADSVWNRLTSAITTASSIGKLLVDNINATISSRATQTSLDTLDDYVDTEVAAIKAKTDQLGFTVANQVDVNVTNWKGSTAPAMTGDAYARLGAPAGLSVSADVAAVKTQTAAIETDTQDIQGRLPAALVGGRIDASVGAMATDVITATALAASAVTEIQTGLSTLNAAQVNAEVDTALADVGLTTTVTGRIDATISSRSTLTAAQVWAYVIEGAYTAAELFRLISAALFGKLSGAATSTVVIRNLADTKARITATVDADGNRSSTTLDGT